MSDEEAVVNGEECGRTEEKVVSAGEAIVYRVRAQAAEKELSELKEQYEKQGQELAELKGKVEGGVKDTPSPLRGTPPLQGERLAGERQAVKTQGVKESRAGGSRAMLEGAARRAAESGSRADIQEYLRARRRYV